MYLNITLYGELKHNLGLIIGTVEYQQLIDNIFFNENITDDMVEKMTMIYANEFEYTETHVSIYESDIYTITIYKDLECINDLALNTPEIIFGDCEIKVKSNYNIITSK